MVCSSSSTTWTMSSVFQIVITCLTTAILCPLVSGKPLKSSKPQILSETLLSIPLPEQQYQLYSDSEQTGFQENGHYVIGDVKVNVRRQAVRNKTKLWPGGVVPYVLDKAYPQEIRNTIDASMREIEQNAGNTSHPCVQFVPRTTESNYLDVVRVEPGCSSYIGLQYTGPQVSSFSADCASRKGIIVHELLHTLGLFHEQDRYDRDNFISINNTNLIEEFYRNYVLKNQSEIDTLNTPYDFNSIMHYGPYSFAKDQRWPVMTPKKQYSGVWMGQRNGLSQLDVLRVQRLYHCAEDTTHIQSDISQDKRLAWCDFQNGTCDFVTSTDSTIGQGPSSMGSDQGGVTSTASDQGGVTSTASDQGGVTSTASDQGGVTSTGSDHGGVTSTASDQGDVTSTASDQGGVTSTASDKGGVTSTASDQGDVTSTGSGHGGVTSTASDQGGVTSTASDQGGVTSTGSDRGGVTSTGSDHSGVTSTASDHGGVTSTASDHGGVTSTASDQGGVTSTASDQGGVTSTASDQGGVTSTGSDHGGVTNTGSDHGGVTSTASDQDGVTNTRREQGGVTSTASDQGGVTNAGREQGGVTSTASDQGGATSTGSNLGDVTSSGSDQSGVTSTESDQGGATSTRSYQDGVTSARRPDHCLWIVTSKPTPDGPQAGFTNGLDPFFYASKKCEEVSMDISHSGALFNSSVESNVFSDNSKRGDDLSENSTSPPYTSTVVSSQPSDGISAEPKATVSLKTPVLRLDTKVICLDYRVYQNGPTSFHEMYISGPHLLRQRLFSLEGSYKNLWSTVRQSLDLLVGIDIQLEFVAVLGNGSVALDDIHILRGSCQ